MADKPILEIPLDTSAFDAFRAKFDAYREKLDETPAAWGKIGKETGAQAERFDAIVAKMANLHDAIARMDEASVRHTDEGASATAWLGISHGAKSFAGNIGHTTLSLARWSGLTAAFSSILSGGGLYGIGRMAMGVSSRRTSALGMGLTYGEAQAYETNFSRLGNAQGLLSGFNEALTSSDARAPLYAIMGGNADARLQGKDAEGALAEALPDIKHFVDRADPHNLQNVLRGTGLDRLGIDTNTALTIRALPQEEIDQIIRAYRSDVAPMDLPPDMAQQWTDFSTQINRAGSEIENHFAENLANLAPSVEHLSKSAVLFVDHMLDDHGLASKWLGVLGNRLASFADWLGSKSFQSAVGAFTHDAGQLTNLMLQIGSRSPDAGLSGAVPADPAQRKANRLINSAFANGPSAAWGVAKWGAKVGGYLFGGDALADGDEWARGYRTPADDDRHARYRRDNAADAAAERGESPKPQGGIGGVIGLRARAGLTQGAAPQTPDQTPMAPNSAAPDGGYAASYDYLRHVAVGGATRPGEIDALHPLQAAKMAEQIRWTREKLGYNIGILSAARRSGQTGSIFDISGKSLHPEGLAGDFDLSRLPPSAYEAWAEHARSIGLYRPWNSPQERNHWQIVPDKHASDVFNAVDLPKDERLRRQDAMMPIPHEHRGQVNKIEIDDHSGGEVHVAHESHATGPMTGGSVWRFGH